MNLTQYASQKISYNTITKHLLHKTLPVCICSLFLLLVLIGLFLNPYSPAFNRIIESNPNQFVLGVPQTKLATAQMLNYVWFNAPYALELSAQAKLHMADVRQIFVVGQALIVLLGICVFFIVCKKSSVQKRALLLWASASSLATLILVSLVSFIGFEKLFVIFHRLLFTNELWLFAPNDTLILFFPQYFFASIAAWLLVWLFVLLGGLLLFLLLKKHRERLSSSKPAQHI